MSNIFTSSGAAEILRSAQKDVVIQQKIEESLSDIILKIFGTRKWLQYRSLVGPMATFLYYSTTTLSGLQTIGEEYTGIVQVDNTLRQMPVFDRRLFMALFDAFGYYCIMNYIGKIENGPIILAFLQGIHRSLFFWYPIYYDFPKRFTKIKYILLRSWLKNNKHVHTFRIIGLIALLTSILNSIKSMSEYMEEEVNQNFNETSLISPNTTQNKIKEKCSLCLENFKNISVTPCGHLFCWNCIHIAVQSKKQCPVCRESIIHPSRIVLIQNYDGTK